MEWRGDGHSLTQFTVIGNCLLSYLFRCAAGSGAHGIASKFYPVGVVQQPVADGVGQGGVADVRMPVTDGALTGDDGTA